MAIGDFFICGYWWLLIGIILMAIGGYFVIRYGWLLIVIILKAIGGYFSNGYWWLLMVILLMVTICYIIIISDNSMINYSWIFYFIIS